MGVFNQLGIGRGAETETLELIEISIKNNLYP
jgi:hypothetical protein